MDAIALIGRILFVLIFLGSGTTGHLGQRKGMARYAASQGIPAAEALVVLSGVMIVVGGLMVALGVWGDLGALLLVFVVVAGFLIHAFWKVQDPHQRMDQQGPLHEKPGLGRRLHSGLCGVCRLGHDLGLTITGPLFNLR